MSKLLKVAVTGAGHPGQWHADKFATNADCTLTALIDLDPGKARAIAHEYIDIAGDAAAYCDYREVIPLVDAISLVVPTSLQYKIAREFLEAGIHCRVEKLPPATQADATAVSVIAIIPDLLDSLLEQISVRGRPVPANGIDIATATAI